MVRRFSGGQRLERTEAILLGAFTLFAVALGLAFGAGAFLAAPLGALLAVASERRRASAHRAGMRVKRLFVAVALAVAVAGLSAVIGGTLSTDSPGNTEIVR